MNFNFNYGKECGSCKNCGMKRIDLPDSLIPCVYDLYCLVDDRQLGSLHNSRAEFCDNYIEREKVNYGEM